MIKKSKKGVKKKRRRRKINEVDYIESPKTTHVKMDGDIQYDYDKTAPKQFSLISNPEETIAYFNSIIRFMLKDRRTCKNIFFDLKEVEYISADTLMYLLAIVKNLKQGLAHHYIFSGNVPHNKEVYQFLIESGYLKYFRNDKKRKFEPDTSKIQIIHGSDINGEVVKHICDYTNDFFQTTPIYTKPLYNVLIELMLNTTQHAYNKENLMLHQWYVFVEKNKDKIKYSFLDTGEGIPQTVSKKFGEGLHTNDSEYIYSALTNEALRSSTKESYRGKGLPKIYKYANDRMIKNLKIISGRGIYCRDENNNEVMPLITLKNSMRGTLFYWEIENPNNIK